MTSTPRPRTDRRCWAGCGRFARPVSVVGLTEIERGRLAERVGVPRACCWHVELVEAELAEHVRRYRERLAKGEA